MSAGHIEHVANQWRVWDHATGGCWVRESEDQANKLLAALELRDEAQALVKSTRKRLETAIAQAKQEQAYFTVRELRKILLELG